MCLCRVLCISPTQILYGGSSLAVQWLGIHAFTAESTGLIPGPGTKIPKAAWRSPKEKRNIPYGKNRKEIPTESRNKGSAQTYPLILKRKSRFV